MGRGNGGYLMCFVTLDGNRWADKLALLLALRKRKTPNLPVLMPIRQKTPRCAFVVKSEICGAPDVIQLGLEPINTYFRTNLLTFYVDCCVLDIITALPHLTKTTWGAT